MRLRLRPPLFGTIGHWALGSVCLGVLAHPATAAAPPACVYADQPTPVSAGDQWRFALVDTRFRLPEEFVPADLVSVRQAGLADDRTLRAPAVADLAELLSAAGRAGVLFELQSAYRSFEYQEQVFSGWVRAQGREQALLTSARPGHSEHQLGTAIDLRTRGGPAPWGLADWAETPEGTWLQANAWRFGFVMSYPRGREAVTCYAYEPWHYRWFGRDAAAEIRSSGLTAREWLWRLVEEGAD
ncbi:MAG: M15 family metallopeptidase [Trueperaceae bacterium]